VTFYLINSAKTLVNSYFTLMLVYDEDCKHDMFMLVQFKTFICYLLIVHWETNA